MTSYPKYGYLGHLSTQKEKERLVLLQRALDLLILRTLIFGPQHGQGIGRAIPQTSEDELLIEHGALEAKFEHVQCVRRRAALGLNAHQVAQITGFDWILSIQMNSTWYDNYRP